MHREILTDSQIKLLPLVKRFSNDFGLAGGTAIALHLGHRRSIDFDLFTRKEFDNLKIRKQIKETHQIQAILVENSDELTLVVDNVKFTFYTYPFAVNYTENFEDVINLPDLLTLAAMKVFALGKRAKWKDYVDLYFIFKKFSLKNVVDRAKQIFGSEFNERLIREQLAYFDDIDYTEAIDYLPGFEVKDDEIKTELTRIALQA